MSNPERNVERVIDSIAKKLQANEEFVMRADFGRITWRWTAKGKLEIKIQAEL